MQDVVVVQCLIEALPMAISTSVSYDGRLLIATTSQSLLKYALSDSPSFDIRLADSRKDFAKKNVESMAVASGFLLAVDGGVVASFSLDSLTLREYIPATKGASLLAVCPAESRDASENSLVAIVVKKRILIYSVSLDGSMRCVKELATPERAHVLVWLNANTIACAHPKRGYFTVAVDSNTTTDLFKFNNSLFSAATGASAKIGIAILPKGQLLLTRNNSGVFVNSDGSPLIERDLEWSGPPDSITYSSPYVMALIAGAVEVRSLTTGGVVQRIDFPGALSMSVGGESLIHIASSNCIWRLLPVSFEDQIEHLIASNQFNEAQRLIEELEFSSEDEKISNIIRVRGLYAHHMFTVERKYEEAISLLSELRASPIDIVNLFPQFSLLGPSSDPPVTDKTALATLKDYLLSQRQILSKLRRLHQRPNTLPWNQIPPPSTSPLTGTTAATIAAVSSLFSGSDHGVPDSIPIPENMIANADDALFLSSVVDTTLLKVYLLVNEGLVGSLVRVENFCDIQEAENALKQSRKYRELIDFYYGKGLHRKALENLDEPDAIMQYLHRLNIVAHVDLFLEFSEPIFNRNVDEGLNIFTERYEDVPLKTHLRIIDFFERKSAQLETRYLEYLIGNLDSERPEFHDRIVLLYLQRLVEQLTSSESPVDATESVEMLFVDAEVEASSSDFLLLRKKLVLFLENSKFYRPERLISLFPDDVLLEEKVVVLGRLKMHRESLFICIEKLANFNLAKRYCEMHYDPKDSSSSHIFVDLLSLLLGPHTSTTSAAQKDQIVPMSDVIQYLIRYGTFMHGTAALSMLPDSLPLACLVPFVEKTLQTGQFSSRSGMLAVNLAKMEHMHIQDALIQSQSALVTLDEEKLCARCSKRIGNSVFACYSEKLLVHVFCMSK
ncbi:CNH domain-containing protein [Chytriomyces cf. hyalinus JEL632]|nr:CNH domain-containing protein [Chytriomyces cf. hyalinus JEL632]